MCMQYSVTDICLCHNQRKVYNKMNITVILEADERQTKRLMAVSQPKGSVTCEEVKETDYDCLHSRGTTASKYITPTSC